MMKKSKMKKSMKLLLSLILIFLICAGSVHANMTALYGGDVKAGTAAASQKDTSGEAAQAEGVVGVWKLVEITGEPSLPRSTTEFNEKLGRIVYIIVNEDGTFLMSIYGRESQGTWDENEILINGVPETYILEGDTLTIQESTDEMIFERSSQEAIDGILGYKADVLDESVSYLDKEETILETEDVSLTITGYKADKTGFHVFLRCENKTDHKRTIDEDKTLLNRFAVPSDWSETLEAKETKESDMVLKPQELEKCGISAVDEIILVLSVSDAENSKFLQRDLIVEAYPTGKKAEEVKAAERKPVDNEQIIVDNEYCTFIIEESDPTYSLGYAVNCYCENKTDKPLTFKWKDCKLNGKDISGIMTAKVLPGTKEYYQASFMAYDFKKAGITKEELKTIQATLKVYDEDSKDVVNTEFTYEP